MVLLPRKPKKLTHAAAHSMLYLKWSLPCCHSHTAFSVRMTALVIGRRGWGLFDLVAALALFIPVSTACSSGMSAMRWSSPRHMMCQWCTTDKYPLMVVCVRRWCTRHATNLHNTCCVSVSGLTGLGRSRMRRHLPGWWCFRMTLKLLVCSLGIGRTGNRL